jgi:hypothetical protein
MRVYINGALLVIETNLGFALPYWKKRKTLRPDLSITWDFI